MNAILCRILLCLIIPMSFGITGAETGIETAPSHIKRDSLLALGEDQLRNGLLDTAIQTFALLVEAHPQNALFRSRLGSAHLARGNFDTAQTAFEHAKQLNPQLPDAYVGLGEVYVKRPAMGIKAFFNFRKAVGEAKRATKIDSTYAPAYRLLGDLYERFRADPRKSHWLLHEIPRTGARQPGRTLLFWPGLRTGRATRPAQHPPHTRPRTTAQPNSPAPPCRAGLLLPGTIRNGPVAF